MANPGGSKRLTAEDVAYMLRARRSGQGWSARCPVPGHGKGRGDRTPALSISEGRDGRVLLHCFAGCEPEEIVAQIGVRMTDLMGDAPQRKDERRAVRLVPEIDPEEGAIGEEILLQLWASGAEVRVSPDHLRLMVSPPERVPEAVLTLAREHEVAVMTAVEEFDGISPRTVRRPRPKAAAGEFIRALLP
jgi:hypothetical protein